MGGTKAGPNLGPRGPDSADCLAPFLIAGVDWTAAGADTIRGCALEDSVAAASEKSGGNNTSAERQSREVSFMRRGNRNQIS